MIGLHPARQQNKDEQIVMKRQKGDFVNNFKMHEDTGTRLVASMIHRYRVIVIIYLTLEAASIIFSTVLNLFVFNVSLNLLLLILGLLLPIGIAVTVFSDFEIKAKLIKYALIVGFVGKILVALYSVFSLYSSMMSIDYFFVSYGMVFWSGTAGAILNFSIAIIFLQALIFNNGSKKTGVFLHYSALLMIILSVLNYIGNLWSLTTVVYTEGNTIYFIRNSVSFLAGLVLMIVELLVARSFRSNTDFESDSSEIQQKSETIELKPPPPTTKLYLWARILINVLMATSVIPGLLLLAFSAVVVPLLSFFPSFIIAYIIPIAVIIVSTKFKLCNPFTMPIGFTLLPVFVYCHETMTSSYGLFAGAGLGTASVGMFYALPMVVITLIIAIVNFYAGSKGNDDSTIEDGYTHREIDNDKRAALPVIATIIIVLTWLTYYQLAYVIPKENMLKEERERKEATEFTIDIDKDIVSAKQICEVIERELKVNKISAEYELEVQFISMPSQYLYDPNNDSASNGIYNIWYESTDYNSGFVRFSCDVRGGKKVDVRKTVSGDKRSAMLSLNFKEWVIDVTDAIKIAEEFFNDREDFKYNTFEVRGEVLNGETMQWGGIREENKKETWNVGFENYNREKKSADRFAAYIDVYTGEILSSYVTINGEREE